MGFPAAPQGRQRGFSFSLIPPKGQTVVERTGKFAA
jgi:hypothetical protein